MSETTSPTPDQPASEPAQPDPLIQRLAASLENGSDEALSQAIDELGAHHHIGAALLILAMQIPIEWASLIFIKNLRRSNTAEELGRRMLICSTLCPPEAAVRCARKTELANVMQLVGILGKGNPDELINEFTKTHTPEEAYELLAKTLKEKDAEGLIPPAGKVPNLRDLAAHLAKNRK